MIKIKIDKKSDQPLYAQIRDHLEQAIMNRELNPGDKLPSVACFAKEIGVTQATIRRAIEDLSRKGMTKCHVGRGTFIENFKDHLPEKENGPDASMEKNNFISDHLYTRPDLKSAARRLRRGISEGLMELMTFSQQTDLIDFSKGIPDPSLYPDGFFEALVGETVSGPDNYITYIDSQGLLPLREEIASRYQNKGIDVRPDQILITNGAQQAAALAAMSAADKKQPVLCETPCFQGITETFAVHGNWVDTVRRDESGPVLENLAHFSGRPFLFYVCPEFQNPVGTDMTPERQDGIVRWALKNGSVILSDDIYQDLRLEEEPPNSFFNSLGADQTIIINSMSKSFIPGLRLGWTISSATRIREFTKLKRLVDHSGPSLMQGIALNALRSGAYDDHLTRIRSIYLERRNLMAECLKQLMPEKVTWTIPEGGFFLWVSLPDGYSSIALLLSAIDRGVKFMPGPLFDIDQRFIRHFRLSFAWTDPDKIIEGVEILADAVKELLRHSPGDSGLSGLGNF